MTNDNFKALQEILRRRRAEAERAQSEEDKSEIWRLAAAEIQFKTFEAQWRKEGNPK